MSTNLRITILLLILIVTVAVFTVGIYWFGWDNQATEVFARIIPVPAAMVNSKFVRLKEVNERIAAHEKLASGGDPIPVLQRPDVLDRLIEEAIIADLAKAKGIVVTEQKLDHYYRFLLSGWEIRPEDARAEIRDALGWSEAKFKNFIVRPDLVRAELKVARLKQAEESPSLKLARFVAAEVASGLDFVAAAKQYSEDEASKYLGGEIGFYAYEKLDPWIANAVFDLNKGEVSEVVISPQGYHIFQVVALDESAEPVRKHVRQIFFRGEDFEEYLRAQKRNYKVYRFSKI